MAQYVYPVHYAIIAISSIAVIFCMLLIIALLIPLLKDLNTPSEPAFSSYNLYLIYLAIPDLLLNLYLVIMYGFFVNQNSYYYYDLISHFEAAFIFACSTANLYLNCVVSNEMLILLRSCHQVIRCDPPSLLRVTLQATAVYMFSIIVFFIHYFFIGRAGYLNEAANFISSMIVTFLLPILFFLNVWITIICRGYMKSVTGRMRQLVWYFFRIVFVFCIVWFPVMCLIIFGYAMDGPQGFGFILVEFGLVSCGIQPIISTFMAMTKSDVRKYTMDLITLYAYENENNNDSP